MNKYTPLILASGIWFIAKFLRYAFPPLFETLQISYSLSSTTIGLVYSCLLTIYALLQFPSGLLADRFGSVILIVTGSGLAAVGALLLSVDLPFVFLIISVVMIGIGTGVHKTVAVEILSKIYSDNTGRKLGIFDTFGSYGGFGASLAVTIFLILPQPLKQLMIYFPGESWRGVFFSSGLIALGLAALFAWLVPKYRMNTQQNDSNVSYPSATEYLMQFTHTRFSVFTIIILLFSFSYNGVLAFLPLFLSQEAGVSTTNASFLYSIVFVVSVVQILTGDISDRVGRLPVIFFTLSLAGAALLAIVILIDSGTFVIGGIIILFALGCHGFRPVRGLYIIELLPDHIASGGFGTIRTILMGAGAVAPIVTGYIADTTSFRFAFSILALFMIGAAFLSVGMFIRQSYNMDWKKDAEPKKH